VKANYFGDQFLYTKNFGGFVAADDEVDADFRSTRSMGIERFDTEISNY